VKNHKVEEAEEQNLIPKAMAFYFQVYCTAFFDDVHSHKKEYAADAVEINER